jgi:uncharacterized membrane protein YphA (DoxX/SURF4 family)
VSKDTSWATRGTRTTVPRSAEGGRPPQTPPRDSADGGRRSTPEPGEGLADRAQRVAAEWAPTVARVMLGLVLAWFGYHELVAPRLWTGYVPGVSSSSTFAIALVLAHGWVLLILAVAIIAGVALRLAAAIAALALLQIVITLTVTGGLSDITLRDVGVFGLAVCLTGNATQRALLTR